MDKSWWCTKEDVEEDLARVGGHGATHGEEGCFVRGERPPPKVTPQDAELELEYCRHAGVGAPDLRGITKMLQMVRQYSSGDWVKDNSHSAAPLTTDDVIVISKLIPRSKQQQHDIGKLNPPLTQHQGLSESHSCNRVASSSKLNPNVKEFIPKSKDLSSSQIEHTTTDDDLDIAAKNKEVSIVQRQTNDGDGNIIECKEADSATDQYQMERKELAAMLKTKINAAGNDDCIEFGQQKNFAIVNLLKLYSSPLQPTPPERPVKLLTPDSFPDVEPCAPDAQLESRTEGDRTAPIHRAREVSRKKERGEGRWAADGPSEREVHTAKDDEDMFGHEARDSIRKVSSWLEGGASCPALAEPPAPPPAPHLGPVAYRRKERSRCGSAPPSGLHAESRLPRAYVPSAHAHELGKHYAERARAVEQCALGPWERVQEELRRRDRQRGAAAKDATDERTS